MITNTCLTGGSFEDEWPEGVPEEPPSEEPLSPLAELSGVAVLLAAGGAEVEVGVVGLAAAGVGVDSESGGSLVEAGEEGGGELELADAVGGGRTTFRRGRAVAASA